MADFAALADEFERAGISLAGASVDPPARQRRLMRQARLPFPLFSDESRAACRALDLLDASELGGLAAPATLFLAADGAVRRLEREGRTERIDARAALDFMRGADPVAPLARHAIRPSPAWRARSWWRYAVRRLCGGNSGA